MTLEEILERVEEIQGSIQTNASNNLLSDVQYSKHAVAFLLCERFLASEACLVADKKVGFFNQETNQIFEFVEGEAEKIGISCEVDKSRSLFFVAFRNGEVSITGKQFDAVTNEFAWEIISDESKNSAVVENIATFFLKLDPNEIKQFRQESVKIYNGLSASKAGTEVAKGQKKSEEAQRIAKEWLPLFSGNSQDKAAFSMWADMARNNVLCAVEEVKHLKNDLNFMKICAKATEDFFKLVKGSGKDLDNKIKSMAQEILQEVVNVPRAQQEDAAAGAAGSNMADLSKQKQAKLAAAITVAVFATGVNMPQELLVEVPNAAYKNKSKIGGSREKAVDKAIGDSLGKIKELLALHRKKVAQYPSRSPEPVEHEASGKSGVNTLG